MTLRNLLPAALWLAALIPAMAAAQSINTVAGNGGTGYTGDGGPATSAEIGYSVGVAATPGGFYIGGWNVVRFVGTDGTIRTVAGDGSNGNSGDGGPATSAKLFGNITGLAVGPDGSLYIADWGNSRIRKVGTNGMISTVASVVYPNALALDPAGNLYIGGACIVMRMSVDGTVSTFAGIPALGGIGACGARTGDGGPATLAGITGSVYGITVDATGNVWFSDNDADRIRNVRPDGIIQDRGEVEGAMGMSADAAGNVYVVSRDTHTVQRITSNGSIQRVAGTQYTPGFSGDGGPAIEATLNLPWGMTIGNGYLLIADSFNKRIRKVTAEVAPVPNAPSTTCASEGYKGAQLTWCQNICENGLTGQVLDTWIHRWIKRYRDLPYCALEQEQPPA